MEEEKKEPEVVIIGHCGIYDEAHRRIAKISCPPPIVDVSELEERMRMHEESNKSYLSAAKAVHELLDALNNLKETNYYEKPRSKYHK